MFNNCSKLLRFLISKAGCFHQFAQKSQNSHVFGQYKRRTEGHYFRYKNTYAAIFDFLVL